MQLINLATEYLASLEMKENVVKDYARRLNVFLSYLAAKKINTATDLSVKILQTYSKYLKAKKISVNSQYVYLSAAKHFVFFLFNRDYLFFNLGEDIVLPKWERRQKPEYKKDQVKRMINRIAEQEPVKSRNQAIVALGLYEKFKTGDIAGLSVLDINLEAKEIRLVRQKRFIKIENETAILIKKYLHMRSTFKAKVDYLFVKKGGERLDQQSVSLALKGAKK